MTFACTLLKLVYYNSHDTVARLPQEYLINMYTYSIDCVFSQPTCMFVKNKMSVDV